MPEKIVHTTEEKVKAAAASCPDAKRVLKTLFPDVFSEDDQRFDGEGRLRFNHPTINGFIAIPIIGSIIEPRENGNLAKVSLYLNSTFTWSIVKDNHGKDCLVAHKKDYS